MLTWYLTLPCNSTNLQLSLCWIPNLCKPLSLVYALVTNSAQLFKYQSSTLNRATLYTMNKCTCTSTSQLYQLIWFCFTYRYLLFKVMIDSQITAKHTPVNMLNMQLFLFFLVVKFRHWVYTCNFSFSHVAYCEGSTI